MTRDEVIKLVDEVIAAYNKHKDEFGAEPIGVYLAMSTVNEIAALLKAEPKRGRWIDYPECLAYDGAYSEDHIVCSCCHHVWDILDNETDTFTFCPNCGAMMVEVDA